jgi:hypothetical protein
MGLDVPSDIARFSEGGVRRGWKVRSQAEEGEARRFHIDDTEGLVAAPGPARPASFGELLNPVEAAQYLRLDETGVHTPAGAGRTLKFWRDRGELRATKYARHVWYRKSELDRFLVNKTEN